MRRVGGARGKKAGQARGGRGWDGGEEAYMRSTESRTFASCTAKLQLVVVFPTPPLPPTKIHLSVSAKRRKRKSALGEGTKKRRGVDW